MVRRAATLVALACLALLAGAGPSFAHAGLISSKPADGAGMATGPQQVDLTFSETVQTGFSDVTVVGPDGRQWQAAAPSGDGAVVSVPVRPLGPAGEYTVGYRVLSADSHAVQGSISFTLTEPGPGDAPADAEAPAAPQAGGTDSTPAAGAGSLAETGGEPPVWPWLVGAGVLVALGVFAALRVGRSH